MVRLRHWPGSTANVQYSPRLPSFSFTVSALFGPSIDQLCVSTRVTVIGLSSTRIVLSSARAISAGPVSVTSTAVPPMMATVSVRFNRENVAIVAFISPHVRHSQRDISVSGNGEGICRAVYSPDENVTTGTDLDAGSGRSARLLRPEEIGDEAVEARGLVPLDPVAAPIEDVQLSARDQLEQQQ